MRAGPLSHKPIVDLLNSEFVNSWMLLSDLERPDYSAATDAGRRLAKIALKEYDYPVETQVYSATGRVLEQLQYNALLEVDPDERSRLYLECLTRSLESRETP